LTFVKEEMLTCRFFLFFGSQLDFKFAAISFGIFPEGGNGWGVLAAGFQSGDRTFGSPDFQCHCKSLII